MTPYILAAIGLLAIYIEFFLPGGILGIIGGIMIFWSYYAMLTSGAGGVETLLFILGTLAILVLLIKYALWKIPRDKDGIYLAGDQEGYRSSSFDKTAIGKEGIAETDLKPGGFIEVEGNRHAAISLTGYIEKGNKIKVISGEGESLMVKLKDN